MPTSLPLHISTTMGRLLTLIAAHARPTRAKAAYIMGVMAEEWAVIT